MGSQLFRTKSVDQLIAGTQESGHQLKKVLGPWSLTAMGVGAVIGTGIWALTGTAALGVSVEAPSIWRAPVLDLILHGAEASGIYGRPGAGSAIALSYLLVAIACGFAALCYAELASMIPVAGSAYTYSYATMGEIVAWIIGWDLVLEYAVSNMAVAVGFSGYLNALLENLGFPLPEWLSEPVFRAGEVTGAVFNLPAFVIVMVLTMMLVVGIRESARANNVMVAIKLGAILIFIFGAARYVSLDNLRPFAPHGAQGILTGAALVFFAYIGFDSVSTAAEECRNPQRDMPIAIISTLVVCMVLYVTVALVLGGIVPFFVQGADGEMVPNPIYENKEDASFAVALKAVGLRKLEYLITVGALLGMISSILVYQMGQARIWFAMSRDRLLPDFFSRVHPKYETPYVSTWIAGIVVAIPAGLWDIGDLAELSDIGTLFAFALVCVAVLVLRRKRPDLKRGFRVPFMPVMPILGILSCLILMGSLPLRTWGRFFVWLALGLVIYFGYGRKRSELHQSE